MNLSQDLQEFLHYPVLQKMDSTTGHPENEDQYDITSQSVLILFLSALYKATRTKEAAEEINKQQNAEELLHIIFKNKAEVITAVAEFTNNAEGFINIKLDEVAAGYLYVINQSNYVTELKNDNYLEDLLSSERIKILPCLPPGLNTGKLLGDESIDDNTNKMEGPVSSLMSKIEGVFSKDD